MKGLVFSLFGAWPDFHQQDINIFLQLNEAGIQDVDLIYCDDIIPSCDQIISYRDIHKIDKEQTCKICSGSRESYSNLPQSYQNKIHRLSDYTEGDFNLRKRREMETLGARRFQEKYRGWATVNNFNLNAMVNRYRLSPSFLSNTYNEQYNYESAELLLSALVLKNTLECFLERQYKQGYEFVVMTHSHRSLMAVAEEYFHQSAIRTLNYDWSEDDKEVYFFSRKETYIANQSIKQYKLCDRNVIATIKEEAFTDARSYLERTYKDITSKSIKKDMDAVSNIYESKRPVFTNDTGDISIVKKHIDKFNSVVCLYTNTPCEDLATVFDANNEIQEITINSIIRLAEEMPETLFMIRDHPNRYISKLFNEPERCYWYDWIGINNKSKNLENILFIYSWDNVDSHKILKYCNIVVSPFSSIVLDAKLAGSTVVTSAYSPYSQVADFKFSTENNEEEVYGVLTNAIRSQIRLIRTNLWNLTNNVYWNEQKCRSLAKETCYGTNYIGFDRRTLVLKMKEGKHLACYIYDYVKKQKESFVQTLVDHYGSDMSTVSVIDNAELKITDMIEDLIGDDNLTEYYLRNMRNRVKKMKSNVIGNNQKSHMLKFNYSKLGIKGLILNGIENHRPRDSKNRIYDIVLLKDDLIQSEWKPASSIEELIQNLTDTLNVNDKDEISELIFKISRLIRDGIMYEKPAIDNEFSRFMQRPSGNVQDSFSEFNFIKKPIVVIHIDELNYKYSSFENSERSLSL